MGRRWPMNRHIEKYFDDLEAFNGYLVVADDLMDWLDEEPAPYILDIREAKDFHGGHIPGSEHVEWLDVRRLIQDHLLPKDRHIVVVCYIGVSSAEIAVILRMSGYDAFSLQ